MTLRTQFIGAVEVVEILGPIGPKIPGREAHARPLTTLRNSEDKLEKDAIAEVWEDVLRTCEIKKIQTKDVEAAVERYQARKLKNWITLEEWQLLDEAERQEILVASGKSSFNKQDNASIEWAQWSWNPVTGCKHDCP